MTKVRVSTVLDNAGYLYPSREYVIVRTKGEMALLESEDGSRRWVHDSFLRYQDLSDGVQNEPQWRLDADILGTPILAD
jgi:hypothetical protein